MIIRCRVVGQRTELLYDAMTQGDFEELKALIWNTS